MLQIDKCFGFDTAVEESQRALLAAKVEASSAYRGIGLVKLMGRQSGFIAMQVRKSLRHVLCTHTLMPHRSPLQSSQPNIACNESVVSQGESADLDAVVGFLLVFLTTQVVAACECRRPWHREWWIFA